NLSNASLYLSGYLLALALMGIYCSGMPKEVKQAVNIDIFALAEMKITWWQKLQGLFIGVGGSCSLYLLSVLGVSGAPSLMVNIIGSLGLLAMGFATLLTIAVVNRLYSRYKKILAVRVREGEGGDGGGGEDRGERGRNISTGEIQEGFWFASFV
ncbi:hypothetical protein TrVE_jg13351, partial [Triparma verrucosa]